MTTDNKKYYECSDLACGHREPIEGDVTSTNADRLNHVKNLSGEKITCGIVIGRFNPIHSSHELLIKTALEQYPKNHIVFVGSSNHPMSFRHIFNYTQRTSYIKEIFPDIRLMGLPDYHESDIVWINYIMDYIEAVFGGKIHHGPFFDAHLGNVSAQEGISKQLTQSEYLLSAC
jgi:cytidyltransferase-like protein